MGAAARPGPARAGSALRQPRPFLPHLPQDVTGLAARSERPARRCAHRTGTHGCRLSSSVLRSHLEMDQRVSGACPGVTWKPPSSAWPLQFGSAAWHEAQGRPHTAWPKGAGLLAEGYQPSLVSRKAALPCGACQCLWCKPSSQARCHRDVTQWGWEEGLPGRSGSLPEPLQVPASQGFTSSSLASEPQRKGALCPGHRARSVCEVGRGWPGSQGGWAPRHLCLPGDVPLWEKRGRGFKAPAQG